MTARPPNIGLHRTRLRQGYGAAQASACLLRAARYDALRGLAADESADSSAETSAAKAEAAGEGSRRRKPRRWAGKGVSRGE